MSSDHCSPCAKIECMEVNDDESVALKTLYERMLDHRPCGPDSEAANADCGAAPCGGREPAPPPALPYDKTADCTVDKSKTVLKRFDTLMMAALESRTAGATDANDKGTVPDPILFRKCQNLPPGTLNSALYGMSVERAVLGPMAEEDKLLAAVDDLMMAEAACKHSGAVMAAQEAARAQPEPKHAEDAARIGAKAYNAANMNDKPGGSSAETPIEVVGYVGCTKPPKDYVPPKDECQ
ncbi:Hypothetical protein CINCED_3A002938 [Cinara cedri]|uniref:Uncharacterized protein n=1 Tax=Cinara cedri TaxID=506608 RepID=A0A5E4NEE6_9HEMI|nr:Hypothetical protein CINCED_3A002938 [Cinara cedri]